MRIANPDTKYFCEINDGDDVVTKDDNAVEIIAGGKEWVGEG